MSAPEIVDIAKIAVPKSLEHAWFAAGGRVIDDHVAVLDAFGVVRDAGLAVSLPDIVNIGAQRTARGVIQDPAGSAVGSTHLSGGGLSGAIYATFTDLLPIPRMAVGAAVFNSSTGPGRRVLHTYSPTLTGDPKHAGDRATALVALADAYANALLAVAARADALGVDGQLCNLVPISGSIFAHGFASNAFAKAHLDPSYTLVAISIAIAYVRAQVATFPPLTVCYFEADVARRAIEVGTSLRAAW